MKENYKVLIVEDDEQIRDGIEIYLRSQGYRISVAHRDLSLAVRNDGHLVGDDVSDFDDIKGKHAQ